MSISVPPREIGSSLSNRQARPLNGIEVREAVESHVLALMNKLLSSAGLLSDSILELIENTRPIISEELSKQTRLQKINVTYPKVGWSIKVRLEELEDGSQLVNGEIELDLERNLRLNIRFGSGGLGRVISSLEEEKIPTSTPDGDRKAFGLPIEAEYLRPDGTVGKVDLRELRGEIRAARTVDVGSGATERVPIQVPTDENGVISTKEILAVGGQQGELITTPDQHPKISLDDLVATPPPEPPKEPLKKPLPPPKSMAGVRRPNVKFKK